MYRTAALADQPRKWNGVTLTTPLEQSTCAGYGSGSDYPADPRIAGDATGIDLSGMVLLVEDNLIIALDTEEMFRELGADRVEIASSVSDALRLIGEAVPTFALLDLNLGAESSIPVAERLCDLNVPIAFASGYGDTYDLPARLAAYPILDKPYTVTMLREALAGRAHS